MYSSFAPFVNHDYIIDHLSHHCNYYLYIFSEPAFAPITIGDDTLERAAIDIDREVIVGIQVSAP